MATRLVTGPVVVLPDGNGLIRYYYQGAVLPKGLDEERVKSAIADGLVSEDKDAGELTVDDLDVAAAGDRLRAASRTSEESTEVATSDERPKLTANKAAWAEYRGLSEDEAKDVTLEQLKDDEYMASYEKPSEPSSPPAA